MMGRWLVGLVAFVASAAPAGACVGDCDLDGRVSVGDLVSAVNVALGVDPLASCVLLDDDGDAAAEVFELVAAVGGVIDGCRAPFSGRYEGEVSIDGETAAATFTVMADGRASGTILLPAEPAPGGGAGASGFEVLASGGVDLETGAFSISGFFIVNGERIDVSLSGTLPIAGGPFSLTLQIGSQTYSGTFGFVEPTPTPTRTPTPPPAAATVLVGQANLPFDPEVVEIDPGETVLWRWTAGPHSVRSAFPGSPGVPNCNPNGLFDSGIKSAGTFSFTFTAAGTYEYHCAVPGHCENFESGIVIVRGSPTPTPTRTPTPTATVPTPTPTPTLEIVNGVSAQLLGTFTGTLRNQFGEFREFPARFELRSEAFEQVRLTDLEGVLFGVGVQAVLNAETPARIVFADPDPSNGRTLTLEVAGAGRLTGTFVVQMGPSAFTSTLDLTRQS
jgi:plastocyanin